MGSGRRFRGRIAGVGSTSGVRVVVGWWSESPLGEFADVMVERADGHRVLLAPTAEVEEFVGGTYAFDEVRVEPIEVSAAWVEGGPARTWQVVTPSLDLALDVGRRPPLGRMLRALPRRLAGTPAFATLVDPLARVVVPGVRTRGVARPGRREYYGATDLREVTALHGWLDGIPLGRLAPVDPPCRFGFSSTPRLPAVTDVVTTVVDT
ncbi:MAG: hypothetical protein ACRCZP_08365 [Phycicoccus sp.]